MSRPSSTIHDNAHAQVIAESDDSDIMDEVVRALSIELKRARVESDRLRAEKDKLQRELDDARLRLSDVEDGREQKVKRDDRSLYEQARREIDKLVQEKDEQNAKHVKEMEDLVQKLTRRKEKCRNVKAALEESRNALTTLRSAAASAIAELSVDGVSTSRKRKREDDDEGHPETTEGGSEARESPQSANELLVDYSIWSYEPKS
ncbi:uncharacterized protein C8Q71DRAFT_400271 [Rhodofomes roseus]|uniref:Uncharacterized protein n=1 Tax=Rhodofomes roseus TaxID=34475 RepID=A0ABQ8JZ24_9APHY|nr:uncharacterized protein C8Q71DRAFT_400271 [Rhodofomes roseus]KAH9829543.1 hypothetical protein C8Q71DRAFT_400271 [Rhodofomes roseus]